jgi:hypothetical protein
MAWRISRSEILLQTQTIMVGSGGGASQDVACSIMRIILIHFRILLKLDRVGKRFCCAVALNSG